MRHPLRYREAAPSRCYGFCSAPCQGKKYLREKPTVRSHWERGMSGHPGNDEYVWPPIHKYLPGDSPGRYDFQDIPKRTITQCKNPIQWLRIGNLFKADTPELHIRNRQMQKYPYKEWNRLIGAPVEIKRNGTTIRSGTVEEAMPDSSLLWIAADAGHGRKLFSAEVDNYEVWIEPRLLDGDMRYRMTNSQLPPIPPHGH